MDRTQDFMLFKHVSVSNPNKKVIHIDKSNDGIDTDGYNNISRARTNYFINILPPFISTHKSLKDLNVPDEIKIRMKSLIIK